MSTITGSSKHYYTTEDVEAMVTTIMREKAIKRARDRKVLSTDTKEDTVVPLIISTVSGNMISSIDDIVAIVSKDDAENKKKRSRRRSELVDASWEVGVKRVRGMVL